MKRGPGRPPKLDRLAVCERHRKTPIAFDGYEHAALERYRDEQEKRTGRRPALAAVVRALVRDWAGLSDDGPTVTVRIHDDTQPTSAAPQRP
jgi:hypothetical protein